MVYDSFHPSTYHPEASHANCKVFLYSFRQAEDRLRCILGSRKNRFDDGWGPQELYQEENKCQGTTERIARDDPEFAKGNEGCEAKVIFAIDLLSCFHACIVFCRSANPAPAPDSVPSYVGWLIAQHDRASDGVSHSLVAPGHPDALNKFLFESPAG